MKMLSLALVAALAASSVAVPTAASARGWHNNHHRHCWTEWRHHHRMRVCR